MSAGPDPTVRLPGFSRVRCQRVRAHFGNLHWSAYLRKRGQRGTTLDLLTASKGVQRDMPVKVVDAMPHRQGLDLRKPSRCRDGGIRTYDPLFPTATVRGLSIVVATER